MKTRVQKYGNSLAIRIPRSMATKAALHANDTVELSVVKGVLIVRPVALKPLSLKELLRGITNDNLPGEWDTSPVVANEAW